MLLRLHMRELPPYRRHLLCHPSSCNGTDSSSAGIGSAGSSTGGSSGSGRGDARFGPFVVRSEFFLFNVVVIIIIVVVD